jgi:hypothetical protein
MHLKIVTISGSKQLKLKELGIAEGIENRGKKKRSKRWRMKLRASLTKRCLQNSHNFQAFRVCHSSKTVQVPEELNKSFLVWVVFHRHHLLDFQVLLVHYRL